MLKFLEGFDSYGAVNFDSQYKWDNTNTVDLGSGRFTGFAAYLDTTILTKTIAATTGMTVGFAIILPENGGDFMSLLDDTSAVALDIGTRATSSLLYITGTTTENSTKPIPRNEWVYLEISVIDFSATASGNVTVRLNGELILSSTLGFTLTGSGTGGGVTLAGGGVNQIGYDDFYICDDVGPYNTTYIEDGEVLSLFPNGPGDETDYSVFGAATNWEAVIEQPFDGDTSYVYSSNDGDQDLYTVANMSIGNTFVIPGIMVNMVARRDNVDPINVIGLIKSSGNVGTGSPIPLTSSYLNYQQVFEREPVTNNPWTETLVNGLQIGSEVG
jgi:hypothetical protein